MALFAGRARRAALARAERRPRLDGPTLHARLYARVDGVIAAGAFLLMEVELIDPSLFLVDSRDAMTRLAEVIRDALIER